MPLLNRRLPRLGVGVLLLALAVGGACECGAAPVEPEQRTPCQFNSDCGPGEHCGEDKFCVAGLEPGTCLADTDCEGEAICVKPDGSDVGACLDPNACDTDEDCGEGRICVDADEDGFRDCIVDGCESDDECEVELDGQCATNEEARCIARACVCQDLCGAPCGEGRQCCAVPGEQRQCIDDPGPCAQLPCDPGFEGVTDDPGPWVATACDYAEAACSCAEKAPLPLGDVGAPHVLLEDPSGGRWVVAYAAAYGDVVVAPADGSPVDAWVFAAGVPAGAPVVAGPSGPRGGVAEPGDDVGRMLDAAFGPDGTLHIVARDETNRALLHVFGPPAGPFSTEVLDDVDDPGFHPQVAVDPQGRLLVVEAARRTAARTSELRLLAQPAAGDPPSAFVRTVLASFDLTSVACEGGCPDGEVCPAAPDGVVPTCAIEVLGCGCAAGEVCTVSGCALPAAPASVDDALPLDHLSLAFGGGAGFAVFGHEGRDVGALVGIRHTGGDPFAPGATFATARLLDGGAADVGNHPAAALVGAGFLVASTDLTSRAVTLASMAADFTGLSEVVLDDGARPHSSGAIENHAVDLPTLALRADGSGVAAWQDGTDGSLRARRRAADGSLGPAQILAGGRLAPVYAGHFGFGLSSLALPGDALLISVKRLLLATEPPTHEVALLEGPLACPSDDPNEEDDASTDATLLATGEVASGIVCGDEDWFAVPVQGGCTLAAELIFRGGDGDLDLALLDAAGATLDEGVGIDDDETAAATVAADGTVFVRVYGFSGAQNAYVLRVDVSCP